MAKTIQSGKKTSFRPDDEDDVRTFSKEQAARVGKFRIINPQTSEEERYEEERKRKCQEQLVLLRQEAHGLDKELQEQDMKVFIHVFISLIVRFLFN